MIDPIIADPEPARPSWRNSPNIAIHPTAEWFPLLPADDLAALAKDIKENRLREKAAVVTKGSKQLVIDGRNRLDALELAGFTIVDEQGRLLKSVCGDLTKESDLDLVDPAKVEAFIISKNIHRRHLTIEQRRDLAAKLLLADPTKSNRAIASAVKLDKNTVQSVRADLEAGGELHHVEERVGKDGKKQPAGKKSSGKRNSAKKSAAKASDAQPAVAADQPVAAPPAAPSCGPLPRRNVEHLEPLFKELEKLLKGVTSKGDRDAIVFFIGNLWADEADAQPTAAVPSGAVNENEPEAAPPEDEPAQPTTDIAGPGDHVCRLVERFNAVSEAHRNWCHPRLDKPEDAIDELKGNETWRDAIDFLTAFVASSPADQAAFRAQAQAQPIAA